MNVFEDNFISLERLPMLCRLCLSVNEKLHQLFRSDETESSAVPLSMKVTLCTAIAISKNDMLPQKICQNCLNYVNEWYLFRKKCKRVNAVLRENISLRKKFDGSVDDVSFEMASGNCASDTNPRNSLVTSARINVTDTNSEGSLYKTELDILKSTIAKENESGQERLTEGGVKTVSNRKQMYKCTSCPDSFYYLKDLKLHKTLMHNYLKLNSISKKSNTLAESDFKLEGINVRTRYEMKCCNKVFFSKLRFRRHYNEKHPGEKPFMCETCGKKDFISEETLKRHKVLHTGKYRCEICFKTFTCNAILILHKRDKHENDKPFICDVCGKRFVTELLMNYHKRFHTGEKKYVCDECGLAVVTSSSLAKHKRIHSKEKPHVCHICGKGFIIKGRLVEHLRVHTGERPYTCQICQKGFTMRDKLKRHIHIHSGEKLFSCEYCGKNYSTRYGLSVHLKSCISKFG